MQCGAGSSIPVASTALPIAERDILDYPRRVDHLLTPAIMAVMHKRKTSNLPVSNRGHSPGERAIEPGIPLNYLLSKSIEVDAGISEPDCQSTPGTSTKHPLGHRLNQLSGRGVRNILRREFGFVQFLIVPPPEVFIFS